LLWIQPHFAHSRLLFLIKNDNFSFCSSKGNVGKINYSNLEKNWQYIRKASAEEVQKAYNYFKYQTLPYVFDLSFDIKTMHELKEKLNEFRFLLQTIEENNIDINTQPEELDFFSP